MNTKIDQSRDRTRPRDPALHATRRNLLVALPLTVGAASVSFWSPACGSTEDRFPRGGGAADLAAKVTKASWPKPKSFVPGMHYQAAYWRLNRLLKSYAGMYAARFHAAPSAAHMLSASDLITDGRCSWSALGAWLDDEHEGFHPDKFPLAWRQAWMIDLQRRKDQLARLGAAIP